MPNDQLSLAWKWLEKAHICQKTKDGAIIILDISPQAIQANVRKPHSVVVLK